MALRKAQPFTEQYKSDGKIWETYLQHNYSNDNDNRDNRSAERQAILKRIFLTLDEGEIEFKNNQKDDYRKIGEENAKLSSEEKIPLASILSHGGRVLIELPPLIKGKDPQEFFNWLTAQANNGEKNPALIKRIAGTHSTKIKNGERVETNPKGIAQIPDIIAGKHFGVNVGLGDEKSPGQDNGTNGHVYIHWSPPSETKSGSLLIGCEGSAPGKQNSKSGKKHGWKGTPSTLSPTRGDKFLALVSSPIHPIEVGGLRVKLSVDQIDSLTQKKANDFSLEKLSSPIEKKAHKKEFLSVLLSEAGPDIMQSELPTSHHKSTTTDHFITPIPMQPSRANTLTAGTPESKPTLATPKKQETTYSYESEPTLHKSQIPAPPSPPAMGKFFSPKTFVSHIHHIEGELKKHHADNYELTSNKFSFEAKAKEGTSYQSFQIKPNELSTILNLSATESAKNTFTAMLQSYKVVHGDHLPKITTTEAAKFLWKEALQVVYSDLMGTKKIDLDNFFNIKQLPVETPVTSPKLA
jgi:hypothetical protein